MKAISRFFSVSLDELLSSDAVLTIAEEDHRQKENHARNLIFGLLDCSTAMLLFLPFFGQKTGDVIRGVPLLSLTGVEPYVRIPYFIIVLCTILWGVSMLALQNSSSAFWLRSKDKVSLALSAAGTLFFTISLQPYAAAFTFIFLIIKALMMIKWA